MDEFSLIRMLTQQGANLPSQLNPDVIAGIGDDTAVVQVANDKQWLLACDTMVEGIHFTSCTMRDADIGYKALAANISDIAAMGGKPRFATVSMTMPKAEDQQRWIGIYNGLYTCAEQYGVAIVGGDTTASRHDTMISVSIVGEVQPGQAVLRSGARSGDYIFVTGWLGLSAAGLDYLLKQDKPLLETTAFDPPFEKLVTAHQRPTPSVDAGLILQASGHCHALNDVSDGTASEAWEIAEASDLGMVLWEEALPLHEDMLRYAELTGQDPLSWALYGGEDYHLIGTLASDGLEVVSAQFHAKGIPLFIIGQADAAYEGVGLKRSGGLIEPIAKQGYNHFE